jgi:hypothetical protein
VQEIQLRLTLSEVNQILDVLGDKSYKQVYELVNKIQMQATAQLQSTGDRSADVPAEPTQQ